MITRKCLLVVASLVVVTAGLQVSIAAASNRPVAGLLLGGNRVSQSVPTPTPSPEPIGTDGKIQVERPMPVPAEPMQTDDGAPVDLGAVPSDPLSPSEVEEPYEIGLDTPLTEGEVVMTLRDVRDWVTITAEGFEGAFPSGAWSVFDNDGSTNGEYYWDDDDYKPHSGWWSAWAARGGANGLDPQDNYYSNNAQSWMVYGPFDLSDASDAEILFYYWNQSELDYDWFGWSASTDCQHFYGYQVSGDSGGWKYKNFDLTAVPTIGNVTGDSSVCIAFIFTSDGSNVDDGPFVDDIVLQKYVSSGQPNLTSYTPSGWDYPIVPSSVQGTYTVNQLCADQSTYVDWVVINEGASTLTTFYSTLYFDGSPVQTWYIDGLDQGWYASVEDWVLNMTPTQGWHTLKIVTDVYNDVNESNESDNEWQYDFYWDVCLDCGAVLAAFDEWVGGITIRGENNPAPALMPPHPELLERVRRGEVMLPDFITDPGQRQQMGIDQPQALRAGPQGSWNALALLVEFTDNTSQVGPAYFDTLLFGGGSGTLNDYYDVVSYGALDIVTVNLPSSIGWCTMPQTYAYYVNGNYGTGTYPQNAQKLTEDAVLLADPLVDFSQYDNDGDGWVDTVFVIHAGPGAEFTGDPNDIWSHSWSTVSDPVVDGVRVNSYTTEPEYWSSPGDMTMGVFAHELGHVFGLPDLYDTDHSSSGVGRWSLMANGSWNGPWPGGSSPAFPDAWSRWALGYVTPIVVTTSMVGAGVPSAENSQMVYRLWTGGSIGPEYFLVENRQQTGYDAALPGAGLLVWHVDENKSGNTAECDQLNNWLCGGNHYKVTLEQADALWDLEHETDYGDTGDPYPGSTNNRSFTFTSVPNSSSYYGSSNTGVGVTSISNSGSVMTVDLSVGSTSGDAYEPDNSWEQANWIYHGAPQTHSIVPVGDEDWVKFELSEDSEVVLETSGPSGDTRMWLYESSLSEMEYNDDGGSGYFSRIDRVCGVDSLPAGTYYVKVDEYFDDDEIASYDINLTVVQTCGQKQWTLLVYLDGDNNLESAGIEDFLEMSSVGSTGDVNVVVQFDRIAGYDSTYGDWTSTKRFLVTSGMTPDPGNAVQDIGEANMGDLQTFIDFVEWGMSSYPADHYAVVLWDHGSGWRLRAEEMPLVKDVCFDDSNGGDAIDMPELRSAMSTLTNGGSDPLDLVGFDACLMAMIEVDNQLIPYADVRVGSEETEPGDGWPYDTVLSALTGNPTMSADQLGTVIVDEYYASYGNDETQSAVDLRTPYADLNAAVNDFAVALINGAPAHCPEMAGARADSQTFSHPAYVDVYDFAYQTNQHVSDAAINAAATAVINEVNSAVIHEHHGTSWPRAHGISIYFPESSGNYDSTYDGSQGWLQFTANTQWDEWLHAFYQCPVQCNDPHEPNDTWEQATSTSYGTTLTDPDICPAGDVDYYSFVGNAGDNVVVDIDAEIIGSSLDSYLYLYSTDGVTELTSSDDYGGSLDSHIDYTLPANGTYYLKVRDYYSDGGEAHFYTMSLIASGGTCSDAYEVDDTWAEANSIYDGSSQTHSICPVGDKDWVKFSLGAESEVVVETSGPSGDTRMWLYDSSLNEIEYDDDGGSGLFSRIDRVCDVDSLPAGTYYVKTDEYMDNDEIPSYDITLTVVQPCAPAPEPDLVVTDISWSPPSPQDGDSMQFTVDIMNQGSASTSAWGPFDVQCHMDGSSTPFDGDVISSLGAGASTSATCSWAAQEGSHTITAVVDDGGFIPESNEGNNDRGEAFEVAGPCSDVYESDDTWGEANWIYDGSPQMHSICPVGDEDWVKFSLSAESEVVIETSGPSGNTRMWLYDSGLNEMEYNDDGNGLFSRIDRVCVVDSLPAGTYYVKVDEFGDNHEIAGYEIIVDTESCPRTFLPLVMKQQ